MTASYLPADGVRYTIMGHNSHFKYGLYHKGIDMDILKRLISMKKEKSNILNKQTSQQTQTNLNDNDNSLNEFRVHLQA